MPLNRFITRFTLHVLLALLAIEISLVVSLRTLGWFGTGSAIQLVTCIFVAASPLLVACMLLAANRLRFSLRALLVAMTLVAVFLTVSLSPLLNHRAARSGSMHLLSANARLNEWMDWNRFYADLGLNSPQELTHPKDAKVPPWLTALTNRTAAIPTDDAVHSIWLNNDDQCQILADNWQRFPSLLSVSIASGVSKMGFGLLQTTLPRFEELHVVHTNDVVPPKDWYRSLTNIRTLWVWGEGMSRGKPFARDHLVDIASLANLEVFMVLGYAFNDADARTLADSPSIKRVILRGTVVTPTGESQLSNPILDRVVYRN